MTEAERAFDRTQAVLTVAEAAAAYLEALDTLSLQSVGDRPHVMRALAALREAVQRWKEGE